MKKLLFLTAIIAAFHAVTHASITLDKNNAHELPVQYKQKPVAN